MRYWRVRRSGGNVLRSRCELRRHVPHLDGAVVATRQEIVQLVPLGVEDPPYVPAVATQRREAAHIAAVCVVRT